MEQHRHTALVVLSASVAIVALLAAVAVGAVGYVIVHRDHTRIGQLERQVSTLCGRRTVTGVQLSSVGTAQVKTAKGC